VKDGKQEPQPEERISVMRAHAFPGVDLLLVDNCWRKWHVFHERYAICAIQEGSAGWRYRHREYHSYGGDIMLIEPGDAHSNTRLDRPADFKVVFLPCEILKEAAEDMGAPPEAHFLSSETNDPRLQRAVLHFCNSVEAGETVLEQQTRFAIFTRILLDHSERRPRSEEPGSEPSAVERAKAYLRERFNQPVTLDELAAVSGLSRFHLVRCFTKQVGMAPHAYQIHVRVERARALLAGGVLPALAAIEVGFADQSHLTRHFKRIWRTTPGSYARAAYRQ